MLQVEQELLTLLCQLSSPLVISGVRVSQSLVFCVMFCRSLFDLCPLRLVIVLYILRFKALWYLQIFLVSAAVYS